MWRTMIIYIQVTDKATLEDVKNKKLEETLNAMGHKTNGYEMVASDYKPNTIRYFHEKDKYRVIRLADDIKERLGYELTPLFIEGYTEKVTRGQVEIWVKTAETKPNTQQKR